MNPYSKHQKITLALIGFSKKHAPISAKRFCFSGYKHFRLTSVRVNSAQVTEFILNKLIIFETVDIISR